MRVAIVGSRKRKTEADRIEVGRLVDGLNGGDVVVSGGCRGVDSWAVDAAIRRGLETIVHLPFIYHTMNYGKMVQEYYRRNRKVVDDSDIVYAFVAADGIKRGGTWYTMQYAIDCGKKVIKL